VVQEQGEIEAPLTRKAYTGLIGQETYVLGVWASPELSWQAINLGLCSTEPPCEVNHEYVGCGQKGTK
jgi:hypothetical protein